jgi:hypothetical protein
VTKANLDQKDHKVSKVKREILETKDHRAILEQKIPHQQ